MGYTLIKIHEVHHFPPEQRKRGLFKDYVNTWLKIKQESAGYPAWAVTPQDKTQYVSQYKEEEGIDLDPSLIQKNPGRKATAKLMLNSFWASSAKISSNPPPPRFTRLTISLLSSPIPSMTYVKSESSTTLISKTINPTTDGSTSLSLPSPSVTPDSNYTATWNSSNNAFSTLTPILSSTPPSPDNPTFRSEITSEK